MITITIEIIGGIASERARFMSSRIAGPCAALSISMTAAVITGTMADAAPMSAVDISPPIRRDIFTAMAGHASVFPLTFNREH